MIGIIAAMNVEMESLRSHIESPVTETIGGVTYQGAGALLQYTGKLYRCGKAACKNGR